MQTKSNLRGKKILLFAPQGKGIYGSAIFNELLNKGAVVHIYNERISTSTFSKIIYRTAKKLVRPQFTLYIKKIIKETRGVDFDYIFIIRGEAFSSIELILLRKAYPAAQLILYLWESLRRYNVRSLFQYFDKTLSYDLNDCEENKNLIFRPLFFTDDYRKISSSHTFEIDILFVGTIHSDRFSFIKKVKQYLIEHGLNFYFYFYFPSRILFLRKKLTDRSFKGVSMRDFNYKMISAIEVAGLMAKSRASVDLQSPTESGLTMRTIEVLGAKRKLITTNQHIKKYDFYNEQNILVIDQNFEKIDLNFLEKPFQDISSDTYEKYSLSRWIDDVFSFL